MTNNKLFFEIWYGDLVYQTKISYGGVVPSYTKDDNNTIENIVEKGYFAANCTVSSKEEKPYLHILGKKRKKRGIISHLLWSEGKAFTTDGERNCWHWRKTTAINSWFSHGTWQSITKLHHMRAWDNIPSFPKIFFIVINSHLTWLM